MASAKEIFDAEEKRIKTVAEYAKSEGSEIQYGSNGRKLSGWYRLPINDAESLDVCCGSNIIIRGADGAEISLEYYEIDDSDPLNQEWSAHIMNGDDIRFEWRVENHGDNEFQICYLYPEKKGESKTTTSIDYGTIRDFIQSQKDLQSDGEIDGLLALYDSITTIVERAGQTKPVEELAEEADSPTEDMDGVNLIPPEQVELNRI